MKIEQISLDAKGRIVLPASFRSALSLSYGDSLYLALDEKNQTIILSSKPNESLYELTIAMGDAPGTLAHLALVLAKHKVDLVSTESHSLTRSKEAVWRIVCKFEGDWQGLLEDLKKNGAVKVEKKKI